MTEKTTIKYFLDNEFAKVPFQASEDAAGYDLFAAEAKTLLPNSCNSIELELKMAIPKVIMERFFLVRGFLKIILLLAMQE